MTGLIMVVMGPVLLCPDARHGGAWVYARLLNCAVL